MNSAKEQKDKDEGRIRMEEQGRIHGLRCVLARADSILVKNGTFIFGLLSLCRVHDLTLHDFLGEMRCTLAEVVSSSGGHGLSRALEGVPGRSR